MRKILIFATIIFIGVMVVLLGQNLKKINDIKKYNESINQKCYESEKKKMIFHWKNIKKLNKDIVAWIRIPGTPIDYPVLQTRDNNFYLNHNLSKQYSSSGSIFVDASLYGTEIFEQKNVIIYGHNMGTWTDVMFSTLYRYLKEDYYKRHKFIYVYLPQKTIKYEIISVFKVNNGDEVYKTQFDKGEYKSWLNSQLERSIYDISNSSHIKNTLTLSTCTYANDKLIIFSKNKEELK